LSLAAAGFNLWIILKAGLVGQYVPSYNDRFIISC